MRQIIYFAYLINFFYNTVFIFLQYQHFKM